MRLLYSADADADADADALRVSARQKLRSLFFRQPLDKIFLPGTSRPLQDTDIACCVSSAPPRYRPAAFGRDGMTEPNIGRMRRLM